MKPLDVALSYCNIGVSLSKKTKGDSIIDLHPDNYLLQRAQRSLHYGPVNNYNKSQFGHSKLYFYSRYHLAYRPITLCSSTTKL